MADLERFGVNSISEPLPSKVVSKKYSGKLFPAPIFFHYGVMYCVPMSVMEINFELKKSCDQCGIFILHYLSDDGKALNFRFASKHYLQFEHNHLKFYAESCSGRALPYLRRKIYWIKFLPLLSSDVDGTVGGWPEEREGEIFELFQRLRKVWQTSDNTPHAHNKIAHFLNLSRQISEPAPQLKSKNPILRFLVGLLLKK